MGDSSEASRRALAILALSLLLAMTTWFSATAIVPQLSLHLDLSATQRSWMTISVQVGFVLGAVASALGQLPDRYGPRRLMLVGSIGAAVANALVLAATGPGAVIVCRTITGACLAGVYPPSLKVVSTWYRSGRGVALGVMIGALTVGSAAPHLVNGLGGLDWRVVIAATSVLSLLGGLIAEYVAQDGPHAFPKTTIRPVGGLRAFKNRGVVLATVGYFGHMWELYAMWAWIGVFLAYAFEAHAVPSHERLAAYWSFAVISAGAIGCVAAGYVADRWGRTRTAGLALVVSGSCSLLVGPLLQGPLWLLVAVCVIWGVTVVADSAQFSTMVTEVGDQEFVGTALTLQLAVGFSLTSVTIWLIPVAVAAVGWSMAFSLLVMGPVVGSFAMLRLKSSEYATFIAGGRG